MASSISGLQWSGIFVSVLEGCGVLGDAVRELEEGDGCITARGVVDCVCGSF